MGAHGRRRPGRREGLQALPRRWPSMGLGRKRYPARTRHPTRSGGRDPRPWRHDRRPVPRYGPQAAHRSRDADLARRAQGHRARGGNPRSSCPIQRVGDDGPPSAGCFIRPAESMGPGSMLSPARQRSTRSTHSARILAPSDWRSLCPSDSGAAEPDGRAASPSCASSSAAGDLERSLA